MKHYCNRRTPRQYPRQEMTQTQDNIQMEQPQANRAEQTEYTEENNDEAIFPPNTSAEFFYNTNTAREPQEFAQGGSVNQGPGYTRQFSNMPLAEPIPYQNQPVYYDNMSGNFNIMSIPQSSNTPLTIPRYLDRYMGKYICLSLWTADSRREEMCGVLSEVGRNFLVIRIPDSDTLAMIDLKTVRYISIFCR